MKGQIAKLKAERELLAEEQQIEALKLGAEKKIKQKAANDIKDQLKRDAEIAKSKASLAASKLALEMTQFNREKGLKEFSNITNIDQALAIMGGECLKSLTWRNFKNVFFYDFSEIKHNPQQVVRSICRYLEIEYDQQFIEDHANLRPSNYNEGIIGNGHKNIEYAKILKFYRSMNYTITNNSPVRSNISSVIKAH